MWNSIKQISQRLWANIPLRTTMLCLSRLRVARCRCRAGRHFETQRSAVPPTSPFNGPEWGEVAPGPTGSRHPMLRIRLGLHKKGTGIVMHWRPETGRTEPFRSSKLKPWRSKESTPTPPLPCVSQKHASSAAESVATCVRSENKGGTRTA